jgi:PQQ-dependent dehydrogenase (s-GDH family)
MIKTLLFCIVAMATISSYAQTPVYNAKRITSTITINGSLSEPAWDLNTNCAKAIVGTPNNTVRFGVMWNSQYLYVGYTVMDGAFYNDSPNEWEDDGIELYIDADNNGGNSYGTNDRQFMKGWNTTTLWEKNNKTTGVLHSWAAITGGYSVEMAIPWTSIGISNPAVGFRMGFDAANNDDDNGVNREYQLMWAGDNDNWRYPRNFGDLVLTDIPDTQAPSAPTNLIQTGATQTSVSLTWSASSDNVAVTGYDIYQNSTKINSALITSTSYQATGLSVNSSYAFYVVARDAAGNTSAPSNTLNVSVPDITNPTTPTNLTALNVTHQSLALSWSAASDNVAVTSYDVFVNNNKVNLSPVTGTNYAVTGLSSSTIYSIYVRAYDAAGNASANSPVIQITTLPDPDTEAPSPPSDLAASSITHNSFDLSWTASTDNIAVTGYDVYLNNSKINAGLVTTTGFTISGLTELTTYTVYVRAFDAAGNFANSASIPVSTTAAPDTQAPSTPTGLAASEVTESSLTLSWNASTDNFGVIGYEIYQDNIKINGSPVAALSFAISGLQGATSYSYYVRAVDAAGNLSVPSSTLAVSTLDLVAPGAPSNLSAIIQSQSTLSLSWTAAIDNLAIAGYDVYMDGVKINTGAVTGTNYLVTGLSVLSTHSFYIVAYDAAANYSLPGNTIEITIPDVEPPSVPSALSASSVTATSLTLNWSASTDNLSVAGYDIFQNNIKITSSPVSGTSFNITGLVTATTYSFYVRAADAAGNLSGNSNTVSVTTPDNQPPSTPSNLASSNLTATSTTLSWTAATDNVAVSGYNVYQNGTKINTSLVTSVNYNVTGLTAQTTYNFFVRALDAAGNASQNSNTVSITTPAAGCTGTGAINFQRWNNITGTSVSNLTSNPNYPNNPSTTGTLSRFEITSNGGDNYGMKVYGYICPPTTGSYIFWIASDDNSELWLSTNSSPATKQRVAYHTQYTNSREWNKYATQKSATIVLVAGQLYYVEALMKEGLQGDNLAVGWAKPGQSTSAPSEVIPGSNLLTQIQTVPDTQAPSAPSNLVASAVTSTSLTLTWNAATDNIGVAGYDVYRDNLKMNGSNITGTSYNVTGLAASTSYAFYVVARDAAGNSSAGSNTVNVTTAEPGPGSEVFTQRTVIANQRMPHDLVYGPDNNLWYTERFAGRVNFVNPASGAKTTVLTLGSKMARTGGQDGLMGLALHPQFNSGKPYVYISYTYQSINATVRKTRIERYTYSGGVLGSPVTILEDIPGSNDHNSARLAIGPDLKLYYSIGDMGAGQYDNQTRANNSQNLAIYEGKILRLNTESVGGSWIPADNPFTNGGQRTAVYSFGHRNPQGLVWGNVNGADILYSSEHGPYSDDEINIIEMSRNYGWPNAIGFCDNNYNGRTTGGFTISNEQNNCTALNVKEPLRSIFPAATPPQEGSDNMGWPSMAPSGTDFYGSTAIPGWQHSLLVAMLKKGVITRYKLSSDGRTIISDTINYFRGKGRFRDVVVSPDGLKIYVACDSSGSTSGPTGGVTSTPANPGSILEFTYSPTGSRSSIDLVAGIEEDTRDKSIDVYPNPASAYVIVYNHRRGSERTIELIDMNGKRLKKMSGNNLATRIETAQLPNGLYILKVTDKEGKLIRTEKLMIQK